MVPSGNLTQLWKITIEIVVIFPWQIVIFHSYVKLPEGTWWLIPLSKWVITPVINGISRVNPLITGVIRGYNPLTKWDEPPSNHLIWGYPPIIKGLPGPHIRWTVAALGASVAAAGEASAVTGTTPSQPPEVEKGPWGGMAGDSLHGHEIPMEGKMVIQNWWFTLGILNLQLDQLDWSSNKLHL